MPQAITLQTPLTEPLVDNVELMNRVRARAPGEGVFGRAHSRIQRFLGFNRGYNVPLWILSSVIMVRFALVSMNFLDVDGYFPTHGVPGESFWLKEKLYRIGLYLHLTCILPCGVLSVFQFLPIIRHKTLILHRINGYLVLLLLLGGVTGAVMVTRHAFGGELSTQTVSVIVSLATTISAALGYYNIKLLQIDQHRKWMLRSMFYMGSIITMRVIMTAGIVAIAKIGTYSDIWDCAQLMDVISIEDAIRDYPTCVENLNNQAIVPANFNSSETVGSALRITSGMGFWLGFVIHAFGVEVYIRLTPGESERLRMLSYEKQLEADLSPAGSCGTTSDRLGDGKWKPLIED